MPKQNKPIAIARQRAPRTGERDSPHARMARRAKGAKEEMQALDKMHNGLAPLSREPPKILEGNLIASDYWRALAEVQHQLAITAAPFITTIDEGAMIVLCERYADFHQAVLESRGQPLVVDEQRGDNIVRKENPIHKVKRLSGSAFMRAARDCGLTPTARMVVAALMAGRQPPSSRIRGLRT